MASLEADVRIFKDPGALSHAAAELVVESAGAAIADREHFLICLCGGKTPEGLYNLLAQQSYRGRLDWPRFHVFWGDERCVPAEDINSNYRQVQDLLLSHVPVPPENIRRVRTELGPEAAAEDYALSLRMSAEPPAAWPRFDLALLGLGSDGHTASLFPGSAFEVGKPTAAVESPDPKRPGWRVTLTAAVFNSARRVVFLATGPGKSRVVADVLYGEHQPDALPAQRIRPQDGELIWLLDAEAAAK